MPFFAFGKSGCLGVATVSAPPIVVCFKYHVLVQCSRSASVGTCSLSCSVRNTVPFFYCCFGDTFRLKLVSISVTFQISIKNAGLSLFLGTLERVTRFAIQSGALAATNCFPFGFPSYQTTHALVVSILKQFITCLRTGSLTSSFAPGGACTADVGPFTSFQRLMQSLSLSEAVSKVFVIQCAGTQRSAHAQCHMRIAEAAPCLQGQSLHLRA